MKPLPTVLLLSVLLMGACAGHRPGPEPRYASTELIEQAMNCPDHLTPMCLERIGRPYRCVCSDRDELRRILEPDSN